VKNVVITATGKERLIQECALIIGIEPSNGNGRSYGVTILTTSPIDPYTSLQVNANTSALALEALQPSENWDYDPVPPNTTAMVRRMILKSSHRLQFSM